MALLLPGGAAQALLEVLVIPGSMALLLPGGEGYRRCSKNSAFRGPLALHWFQGVKALLEKAESCGLPGGPSALHSSLQHVHMSPRGVDTRRAPHPGAGAAGRPAGRSLTARCAAQPHSSSSVSPSTRSGLNWHVSAGPLSIGTGATADGSTVCSCSPEGPCRLLHQ